MRGFTPLKQTFQGTAGFAGVSVVLIVVPGVVAALAGTRRARVAGR